MRLQWWERQKSIRQTSKKWAGGIHLISSVVQGGYSLPAGARNWRGISPPETQKRNRNNYHLIFNNSLKQLKNMTRTEFIHQAVISMAGKVIGANGVTDGGEWENMVREADELADIVAAEGYGFSGQ